VETRSTVKVDVWWWSFLKLVDLVLKKLDPKASTRGEFLV
jgi:hypothetical protein